MRINHQKRIDGPFYTEGPVIDHQGNIFYTNCAGGQVLRWDGSGDPTVWATGVCPNGQFILPNGDHLVCDSRDASVNRYDLHGQLLGKEIAGSCAGQEVFVPNDLVVSLSGNLYFTDSIRHQGKLCFKSATGVEKILATELDFPNGLILSPDEKHLYVAESYRNRILLFHLDVDGGVIAEPPIHWFPHLSRDESVGAANRGWFVFCDLPTHPSGDVERNLPDGLALDDKGNLWVAHYGMQAIQILSPQGAVIDSIDTGFPLASNVFLKGDTCIVTGGHGEPGPGAVLQFTIG